MLLRGEPFHSQGWWQSLWLYCKWCMKYGGWPGEAVRVKGDYWRGMKKPIRSSCRVALRRSPDEIDCPLLPHCLPLLLTRARMGSAQLRRHLLQDLCGTHTARNSWLCLLEEPMWIELELRVNIPPNPSGPMIRVLLPHLSNLCGRVHFYHFETCKLVFSDFNSSLSVSYWQRFSVLQKG